MSDTRPAHFQPGTLIGTRYRVEGLVRLAEDRMFYLADDDRPDQSTRRCVACGEEGNRAGAGACSACGAALGVTRFLMSSRWDASAFDAWQAFAGRGLDHPGLALPVDVVRLEDQVLSLMPYQGEGLLLDEAAPLTNQRALYIAQRAVGVLAWLGEKGVAIGPITRSQILMANDGSVRLFDLDVCDVTASPVSAEHTAGLIRSLAELLAHTCHVRASTLIDFLGLVSRGDYPTPYQLGRAIEQRYDTYAALSFSPDVAAITDVGLARQLNEDSWGWMMLDRRTELFVVADGMGGHEGGEIASNLAVETIVRVARERIAEAVDADQTEALLASAFVEANNAVKAEAERRGNDMGTTLVAMMLVDGRQAYLAYVGDSRIYRFRQREVEQLSTDHSFVQKLVDRGKITKEEARNHPQSNILLRTVGTERDVEVDLARATLEPGDRVMLCSDGMWGEASDQDMAHILAGYSDLRVACRELVRASHQGGGHDNCTVVLVNVR